ncbi:MAG: TetR/AcrR family transcriptional regulator [Thermodesulfobacteriota bacterium]|nr:TetR/AcrR family transcriptional regulator [Thermodesulfobacteriota bacterium]
MGIKERKERDVQKMRQRILEAAMGMFAKGGYQAVSMRRIARQIEYSAGTIYRYFENKEDIMLQLCFQGFERLLAMQMELEEIPDPIERVKRGSRLYVAFAVANPELYELMFGTKEIIKQPEGAEESVALKSLGKFVAHVQQCLDAGYFSGSDAQTLAIALWASLHGLSLLLIKEQFRFLPEERVDQVVEKALAFTLRGGGKDLL